MVGALAETVQDAHAAPGLGGGGEDRVGEGDLIDDLRAAEGEHQAAGRHAGEGGGKVTIYHRGEPVLRHIPDTEAIDELLRLIEREV